jgi:hypothetical protein
MRERKVCGQAAAVTRVSRESPLAEHIRRILEDDSIVAAWNRLAAAGNTDWRIANIIAEEQKASARSIEGKIKKLRKSGKIGENPNKKAKRHRPGDLILATRENMVAQGKCDGRIASEIAKATGASVGTLKTTISAMVKAGKIPPNPNNQVTAESKEFSWIRRRRRELMKLNLTDTSISRVLAFESEVRNQEAVRRMLWEMVADRILGKNENSGWTEMEEIILGRYVLMDEGLDDREIAAKIGEEWGRKHHVIGTMIYRAVHMGGCRVNPN